MSDADCSAANGGAVLTGQPYTLACKLHAGGIGWIALCRKPGVGGKPMWQRSFKFDKLLTRLPRAGASGDCYISLNAFKHPTRKIKHLASLRGNFIDLDTYKAPKWERVPPEEIWAAIAASLSAAGIPLPQMAIFSGRGIQLVWVYPTGLPAAALPRWRAVQKHVAEALQEYAPDYGALDAARLIRLPGTYNSKSEQRACFLHLDMDGATDFELLAARVLPVDRSLLRERRQQRAQQPSRIGTPRGAAVARYLATVLGDIQRLIDHRWRGRIPPGSRNNTLYGCFLVRLVGVVALPEELIEFGTRACTLDDSEMEQIAASVTRKLAADGAGYRFRAATAAEWLGVTIDEVRAARLVRLHPADPELIAQRRAARRLQNRQQKREKRRAAGIRPRSKSLSQTRPWTVLGVSRATWYRLQRDGNQAPQPAMRQSRRDLQMGNPANHPAP